jgi:protease-4
MRAIVVRIDSPGGAVGTSQEILDGLRRLAEDKVVVCAMGNVAASGASSSRWAATASSRSPAR